MELPIDKPLRRRIPLKEDFSFLETVTKKIQEISPFELVDDWGYEWQGTEHFLRLFYNFETKTQATVCLSRDEMFTHAYVKVMTRAQDGKVYTTWNYPFSASLKLSPEQLLHWDRTSSSFEGIIQSHHEFLERHLNSLDEITHQAPEEFLELLQRDQRRLVDHNLSLGVLKESGKGMCRYTWRSLVFSLDSVSERHGPSSLTHIDLKIRDLALQRIPTFRSRFGVPQIELLQLGKST
ncbi:MAG: hypothetical protein ACI8T1_001201 [Verrucomicrobiales bacterium]|jgi:hypothetical protein